MKLTSRWFAGIALAGLATLYTPSAQAAVSADTGSLEIFAGWYSPDADVPGESLDDVTYGMRGGYNFTKHFMLQFGGQYFNTDYKTIPGTVDIDIWMFDISMGWMVNPDSRGVFHLYGGPGWSSVDVSIPAAKDESESGLSVHVGVGVQIAATDRFYIRPDARYRWVDGDEGSDDRNDWEATLGFGWYLGANVGQ